MIFPGSRLVAVKWKTTKSWLWLKLRREFQYRSDQLPQLMWTMRVINNTREQNIKFTARKASMMRLTFLKFRKDSSHCAADAMSDVVDTDIAKCVWDPDWSVNAWKALSGLWILLWFACKKAESLRLVWKYHIQAKDRNDKKLLSFARFFSDRNLLSFARFFNDRKLLSFTWFLMTRRGLTVS